ncbi:Acg family FMN-binding oxidoreductase [Deinococcus sp. UYEF24]
MSPAQPPSGLTRRQFVGLLAASGVTVAGGYALYEYTPWLNYDAQATQVRSTLAGTLAGPAGLRNLVRAATLAPSSHNTQPWKFSLGQNVIEIHPDRGRQLFVLDPQGRELWISLGCALENLLIAAHAAGYATEVTYPGANEFISVRLSTDKPQSTSLLAAIVLRQNTRSEYDGLPIATATLRQLQAVRLEPGVSVRFVLESSELKTVLEYISQGTLKQYADPAFVQELIHWLRFTRKDALAKLDGLYTRSSGNPEVPRWLGQLFVNKTRPQGWADADAPKFRSSSGAVLVASMTDDKAAWVRSGQVYERLALGMTALGVQSACLNQPNEVESVRSQFQGAMKLEGALPQMLLRFGHGLPLPGSLRRPVEAVVTPS